MASVVQEFREARGLQPLRVLVHGNDDVAKAEIAAALAKEYKVTHVTAAAAAAAGGEGETTAQALVKALSTVGCRNQGYILEGFPANLEEAGALFASAAAKAEGEEEAEAEAE